MLLGECRITYNPMQKVMGVLIVVGVFITSLMIIGSMASVDITADQSRSSGDDDIEFHFNRLNKPAVKSITLKDGDVIDCVDIYKQPAFDHPLLKNHTIRILPSFVLEKEKNNEPHMQPLWKESEGCPEGTIPIRRTQKAEIIRAPFMGRFGKFDTNGGTPERAGMYLDGSFHGVKSNISIEQPNVEQNEWSHANIEISEGGRKKKFFMEAGWLVNHQLFGDPKTRLYTFWTVDGYGDTGCYNVLCPGFVQVSRKAVLGAQLGPISEFDGLKYVVQLTIQIDPEDLKWWLVIGDEPVGYWPPKLFSFKMRAAGTIQWAGSVLNMRNRNIHHTLSFMGTGVRGFYGPRFAAFFADLLVKNVGKDNYVQPDGKLFRRVVDDPRCYTVAIRPNERIPLSYGGNCN